MNELKNFREKWINKIENEEYYEHTDKLISDLIDECETNLFLKDIVTKTRIDTLRQVLPKEKTDIICTNNLQTAVDVVFSERENNINIGHNRCIEGIIEKAKELYNIKL